MFKSADLIHLDFYVGGGGGGHIQDVVHGQVWKDGVYVFLHF